jgi:hypothetical protein
MKMVLSVSLIRKDGPSRQKSREFKSEKKTLTPFDAVCKMWALRQGCPTGAPAFSCKKAGGNPEFTAVKVFLSYKFRRMEIWMKHCGHS